MAGRKRNPPPSALLLLLDALDPAPRCARCPVEISSAIRATGYFSVSTTYRRTTLVALSRWGARSDQAFDL